MKNKKKKLNKKKLIFFILIIFLIIYLRNLLSDPNATFFSDIFGFLNSSNYKVIKQDKNKEYVGIGQETVKNKDGYFTTFTTTEDNKKIYKEYKQNGKSSWAKHTYWGGTMTENGCGITSMAIILSGYNKDFSPEDLRNKYYPVLDYSKISKELSSTFGIKNTDFYYDSTHLSKKAISEHLQTNRPILVCVWNKPSENRWTTSSHYMVLLATDGNGMVYISNPNRA